jgi:protein-tyrosine phosphatase
VVAHPERYTYIQEDPALLNLWVQMGCLLQINKGSLLGRFGRREAALSYALVQRGFAFAVASDAHASAFRTTWMRQVQDLLSADFSPAVAQTLLTSNPRRLLSGGNLPQTQPDFF